MKSKIWLVCIFTFILAVFAKSLTKSANQELSELEVSFCIIAVLCSLVASFCWFLILAEKFIIFAKLKAWYFFHLRRNFFAGEFSKRLYVRPSWDHLKRTASFGVTVASIWVWGFLSIVYSTTIFFLMDLLGVL